MTNFVKPPHATQKEPETPHSASSPRSSLGSTRDRNSGQAGQAWWQPGVMMFARMSAWIVAPVLIGTLLGRWLDRKFETEPLLFISTVGLAFLLSMFGLVKNVVSEYKKIEKELNRGKTNKNG